MPGIVAFKRRWSVGSDDLVVPGIFLCVLHTIWLIVLGCVLGMVDFEMNEVCATDLYEHMLGYLVILTSCLLVEVVIVWVSMRGSILYTTPRDSMQYLLYLRLVIYLVEVIWLILGVVWMVQHYESCSSIMAKKAILGIVICNWVIMLSFVIILWCTFDTAGRSWVKMKRYQQSLRASRKKYKRSGNRRRNWRNRKTMKAYQESWDRRCRILLCCVGNNEQHSNSFTEVAKLLSEFFRDLDVVPSDVIAGLVLLRREQKINRSSVIESDENDIYQYMSGVAVTPRTKFLNLKNPRVLDEFNSIVHYMRYALAIYGWPMYLMVHKAGVCQLLPHLGCCCLDLCRRCKNRGNKSDTSAPVLIEDNCCQCHLAAVKKFTNLTHIDLVYVTYHVDVGETPFFVALDHLKKKVVISIRGTLSVQDVLTDLNADAEQIPINPPRDDWFAHKGMVQAAEYIRRKLDEDNILPQAFGRDVEKGTHDYELVLVGHSLGAGAAVILALLLQQEYPNLFCYAFSPPGGLLSDAAAEHTKSFCTSVVVGKDVVPRIGLSQMEALRSDLINAIKKNSKPKWSIIASSLACCNCGQNHSTSPDNTCTEMADQWSAGDGNGRAEREVSFHPTDSTLALTTHTRLYPPGRLVHIVRSQVERRGRKSLTPCSKTELVYQAVYSSSSDLDEVLISPVMVQDHMPDRVLDALEKVLQHHNKQQTGHPCSQAASKYQLTVDDAQATSSDRLVGDVSWECIPSATAPHINANQAVSHISPSNSEPAHDRPYNLHLAADCGGKDGVAAGHWIVKAPLASPEHFSDISSITSIDQRLHQELADDPSSLSHVNEVDGGAERSMGNRAVTDSKLVIGGDDEDDVMEARMWRCEEREDLLAVNENDNMMTSVDDEGEVGVCNSKVGGLEFVAMPRECDNYEPTYPEYTNQEEYGCHSYEYPQGSPRHIPTPDMKIRHNNNMNSNNNNDDDDDLIPQTMFNFDDAYDPHHKVIHKNLQKSKSCADADDKKKRHHPPITHYYSIGNCEL